MANYKGEFLMRRFLDLRVADEDFVDNARPNQFTNPETRERLECDRLYVRAGVAFEFNGPQHFQQTEMYSDERAFKQRRTRDILKKGLSLEANVILVTVTASELYPAALDALIPARLKRRPLDTEGPVYRALVDLCTEHVPILLALSTGRVD